MTQQEFVDLFAMMPDWGCRYEYIMERCSIVTMPPEMHLPEYRIESCLSKLYFKVQREDFIHIMAWGNNPISLGLAGVIYDIFEGRPLVPNYDKIFFHKRSGLLDHLSPARAAALIEMLQRLTTA